jgi:PEP-CTERM motif
MSDDQGIVAMRLLTKAFLPVSAVGFLLASPTRAATIIGGTTQVTLTAAPDLVALGFVIQPSGTATLSGTPPVATFAITGGTVTGGDAVINHDGSGLTFTKDLNVLSVSNFRIDTAAGLVTSDVVLGDFTSSAFGLFDIGPGLTLRFTSGAGNVFATAFGAPGLGGALVGTATVNPILAESAIPEPTTWTMLVIGFGLAGFALRRRSGEPEMRFHRSNLFVVPAGRV